MYKLGDVYTSYHSTFRTFFFFFNFEHATCFGHRGPLLGIYNKSTWGKIVLYKRGICIKHEISFLHIERLRFLEI